MLPKSLYQLVKSRILEFMREPSAVFFIFIMPFLWIVFLGLSFSQNDKKKAPSTLILSSSNNEFLTQLCQNDLACNFESSPLQNESFSTLALDKFSKIKHLQLVITQDQNHKLQIFWKKNDQESQINALETKIKIHELAETQKTAPPTIEDVPVAIGFQRYIDFMIPGLLCFGFLSASLFGTGMTIVSSRRENLLKRYLATPMSPFFYILSHMIGRFVLMLIEIFVVCATGMILFNFKIHGSLPLFLAMCTLGASTFTSLAILCAARLKNTSTYHSITNLLTFPMMILSGVWFSRDHLPDWLNPIIQLLPLSLLIDALRSIVLDDGHSEVVILSAIALSIYTVIFTVLAKKWFKWF